MTSYLKYLWGNNIQIIKYDINDTSVAVAESVTAGALINTLCSEPGASKYFKGGIVTYSRESNKELLNIDISNVENNNFANPFTTADMAKKAAIMFKSRFGLATTGYSLPLTRHANKETGECELIIEKPYAYICLYDQISGSNVITRIDFPDHNPKENQTLQRAQVQVKVALKAQQIYNEYVSKIQFQ
jgi:PncC family amidohydrolase